MPLNDKLEMYFKDVFSGPDSCIYHYTQTGNGQEILNSGHFRLTPHQELNSKADNGELIVGPELARKYLKKTNLAPWESTFDTFISRGITLHIGSFCEERNHSHALKKYGSDCLEFNDKYLKKLQTESVLLGRVKYNQNEQNEIISNMFQLYEQEKDEDLASRRTSLFLWLFTAFPLLKEEKHHRDEECRTIKASGHDRKGNQMGNAKYSIDFNHDDIRLVR